MYVFTGSGKIIDLTTNGGTPATDTPFTPWDDVLQAMKDAGLTVSFWNVGSNDQFPKGAKRITYNSYSSAHLGREYIRQQQAALAAKYPTI